jgi:hypothetical protein
VIRIRGSGPILKITVGTLVQSQHVSGIIDTIRRSLQADAQCPPLHTVQGKYCSWKDLHASLCKSFQEFPEARQIKKSFEKMKT